MSAKAALAIIDLEAERAISVDVFTDDGTGADPRLKAELLWESVADDWPNCKPAYCSNEEADALATQRLLWQVGMTEPGEAMHDRMEAATRA